MIKKWLLRSEKSVQSSSVVWNAIGGVLHAGQSSILLIFVSRQLGLVVAGMVTIAYAWAQLFYSVGRYGVRHYQVTDVREQLSFRDYFSARLVSLAVSGAALAVYLFWVLHFGDCEPLKAWIILEVVILRLEEALEDVFIGRFQQRGRLDVGAKIMATRLIVSTALICVAVMAGMNICVALLLGILCSVALDLWFLGRTFRTVNPETRGTGRGKIGQVLRTCFPLCVSTTLAVFIGNVPKYMIDGYMDEATQAIFGYIMMPVFLIMLLNQFIYQPLVKNLGDLWAERAVREFRRKVFRQCLIVVALLGLALVLGWTIGLPVLTFLYGTQLGGYRAEFMVLILGGGFYALAYYLNVPITTMRKQKFLALGYVVASAVALLSGRWFVLRYGMMGAAVLYLVITALLAAVYFFILLLVLRKNQREIHT